MKHFRDEFRYQAIQRGFSLMEVLIGIAIFAIGMLALASLQGALTRSTAEAKVRTTAVNIAERIIEGQRGFALVSAGAGTFSFADIVDVPIDSAIIFDSEMTRDPGSVVGVEYTVTQDVTDYYYDLADDVDPDKNAFTTEAPIDANIADYKTVLVTVAWNDNREFVIDEGRQTTGNLGGGSIQVSATISNVSVAAALKVSEEEDGDIIAPDIVYTPGLNPDIISLDLGGQKFKESLTPEPKVYRDNTETRFDVVTYSQSAGGEAFFLRREEFVATTCDCTLHDADVSNQGMSPAIWAGDEYTEPVLVTKAYGTPAGTNNSQSSLCGACCRDHHDSDGALYDPSRPNHNHYYKRSGSFVVANSGDDYVEACRFVRKDGFFRLTQDFRLEGLNTFPEDYLINTDQVADYSTYVTEEVYIKDDLTTYVPAAIFLKDGYQLDSNPPTVETAPRTASGSLVDGDLTLGYTNLPTSTGAAFQQLRSRSIYIDNLSSDLRGVINCIEEKTPEQLIADPGICDQGDVKLDKTGSANILELIPFFEIQTTFLNDWHKKGGGREFTLTNQTVTSSDANGPTHSRGKAENPTDGSDMSQTYVNRGVTGVTSSDPIDPINNVLPLGSGWPPGDIEVIVGVSSTPLDGRVITGTLSSEVPGLKAANVRISATNAICNYITTSGLFTCFIPTSPTGNTVTLTVSGFDKPPKAIYLCSSHQFGSPAELPVDRPEIYRDPKDVDLTNAVGEPHVPVGPYELWLTEDACPAGGWGS